MEYSYLIEPLIGALIGYLTNWIAVKMMFRPRKAIIIGKFRLPFTPGIIPKNRENIAYAISSTITNNLLTEQDLRNTLLSKEMKEKIIASIKRNITDNKESVGKSIERTLGKDNLASLSIVASNKISDAVYQAILKKQIGTVLSEQIEQAVKEKIGGSIFSIFGGRKIINSIKQNIEIKINEYIVENGETKIHEMVDSEINEFLNKNVSEVIRPNNELNDVILKIYENIVIKKLPSILSKINVQKIIEDKINHMDMVELENLILKVMKKELNAIVNLGAIIGLILGMINLLF